MSNNRPFFLLCNDDGVHAPGIRTLAEHVRKIGDVVIVAPHIERSASSHAISISQPLRVEEIEKDIFAVEGTPADCVMFALQSLLNRKPDWVLSGINRGSNMGNDTLYSGTVGAAMEGVLHGIKALAVSAHGKNSKKLRYDTAAEVAVKIIQNGDHLFKKHHGVINLNVPDVSFDELNGVRVATLGKRIYEEKFKRGVDPRGREYYWVGGGGHHFEHIPGSDCVLIEENYATVTFLQPSLSYDIANQQLTQDLKNIF